MGEGGEALHLAEEAAKEAAERSNACAGGNHDVRVVRVLLGHEHDLARRASQLHLIAGLSVAEVVRAHALLGRILLASRRIGVSGAADAQGGGLAGLVVTCLIHTLINMLPCSAH